MIDFLSIFSLMPKYLGQVLFTAAFSANFVPAISLYLFHPDIIIFVLGKVQSEMKTDNYIAAIKELLCIIWHVMTSSMWKFWIDRTFFHAESTWILITYLIVIVFFITLLPCVYCCQLHNIFFCFSFLEIIFIFVIEGCSPFLENVDVFYVLFLSFVWCAMCQYHLRCLKF